MMDHQIVFTPDDVYRVILAIAGFIVSVAAAIRVILEAINKAKEPDKVQNERITNLEDDVMLLKRDFKKYAEKQERQDEAWNIYMQAMFALINHSIDGDDVEELKVVRKQMQSFLTKYNIQ